MESRYTVETAKAAVSEAFQEMAQLGANDYEHGEIAKIIDDLDAGILSPDDAVDRAHVILAMKEDYH